MPFSDPVADGPVIQRASERALKRGTSLAQVLQLAAEIRATGTVHWADCIYVSQSHSADGHGKFCEVARAAGVDGVLVTDLPVEEAGEYLRAMREYDLVSRIPGCAHQSR